MAAQDAVVFDNKMWILGGYYDGNFEFSNKIWYSTDGQKWTVAGEFEWLKRFDPSVIVYDNKMWVSGGMDIKGVTFNDVWCSSNGKDWTCVNKNAEWEKRCSHRTVVYNNEIWLLGGGSSNKEFNDVWHSSNGINWTKAESSTERWKPRSKFGSIAYNNRLWVIGGTRFDTDIWYTENNVNTSYEYKKTNQQTSFLQISGFDRLKSNVEISYQLNGADRVKLGIYDCSGKEVVKLYNGSQKSGLHKVVWNGTNQNGVAVPAGIYFVKIKTDNLRECREIIRGF